MRAAVRNEKDRWGAALWLAFLPCLLTCVVKPSAVVVNPTPPELCHVRAEANGYVPGVAPAKFVRVDNLPYPYSCESPEGFVALARAIACSEGYAYAAVVNIRAPRFPRLSVCYAADLELYSTAEGATVSTTPIWRYPDIPATGVQLLLGAGAASVLGGPQDKSGLINSNGDEATTSKAGFGITLRYYPLSFLGAELETGALFGQASAPQTNDLSFTREWISNLGLSVVPWQRLTLLGRLRVVASAGVSHTRLTLTEDYKNFVRQQSPVVFYGGPATGFGWYSRAGFHMVTPVRVFLEIAVRYAQSWPRFPDADQSFWSRQLGAEIGVGYQF